jgi:hypothetical protein
MKVIYISGQPEAKEKKPARMTPKQEQVQRVRRWMDVQYQRAYDQAIKDNWEEILEIQKSIPGWMPDKDI